MDECFTGPEVTKSYESIIINEWVKSLHSKVSFTQLKPYIIQSDKLQGEQNLGTSVQLAIFITYAIYFVG